MIFSGRRWLRKELAEVAGKGEKANTSGGQNIHPHAKSRRSPQLTSSVTDASANQLSIVGTSRDSPAGRERIVEKTWRKFFSDPSQWWDHRLEKVDFLLDAQQMDTNSTKDAINIVLRCQGSARHPDFKHKKTQESLWLDSNFNPSWVVEELAALAPGTVQSNIFSWNKRLASYVKAGEYQKTLELFQQMQQEGINSDQFTFVPVLNACARLQALEVGRQIHTQIVRCGYESDLFVGTCLVDMYSKCGTIEDAHGVFKRMPVHNVVSWSAMILGYVKCGNGQKALELFQEMAADGLEPNPVTFVGLLNACASLAALQTGRYVHERIVQSGCESNIFIGNSLVHLYAKCGSIEEAWKVFKAMPTHNVVSWNAMIMGFVKCGEGQKALELFGRMQLEGIDPNPVTLVGVLNACASVAAIEVGMNVHKQIIQSGFDSDVFVGNCIIDMYAKCGRPEDARRVFNIISTRDVVTWNTMITGYVKCHEAQKALELFQQMHQDGLQPNAITFMAVLKACASVASLREGRYVHAQIAQSGLNSDVSVGSSLVDMYVKCGSIEDAWSVFKGISARDVVAWTAMIQGYLKRGRGQRALEIFQQMLQEGVEPDATCLVGVLNACASIAALEEGKGVHKQVIQRGYESDVIVGSSLVDMYMKCGSLEDAWKVFNEMTVRDVVTWTAMILGCVKSGHGQMALKLFWQMQQEGLEPDLLTFVGVLSACASEETLQEGRRVHEQIIQRGCESDVYVGSSLVDMYAKCGSLEDALRVFKTMPIHDVVSWSAMILGCVKCGEGQKALELSRQMQQEVEPNPTTFVGLLTACASVAALEEGRCVHQQVIKSGYEHDVFVTSSLIDMYAKCGSIEDAYRVFSTTPTHDMVSWTAMLGGYAMHGLGKEALLHFKQMCQNDVEMDELTFTTLLTACSHGGLLDEGLHFFALLRSVYNMSATVGHYACMVDLLGRAGHLHEAEDVLKCVPDARVWSSLIGACRVHGNLGMGDRIVNELMQFEPENAAGYLLSNIYAAAGE